MNALFKNLKVIILGTKFKQQYLMISKNALGHYPNKTTTTTAAAAAAAERKPFTLLINFSVIFCKF